PYTTLFRSVHKTAHQPGLITGVDHCEVELKKIRTRSVLGFGRPGVTRLSVHRSASPDRILVAKSSRGVQFQRPRDTDVVRYSPGAPVIAASGRSYRSTFADPMAAA